MWSVRLHKSFVTGANNTDFCVDEDLLAPAESEVFYAWLSDLLSGQVHVGKNKESWIDRDCKEIPQAASYKKGAGWHYHCGPTFDSIGAQSTPAELPRNMNGRGAKEAVHYSKAIVDTVTVLGFSRKHIPFLNDATQASAKQRHPFFGRLGSPRSSVVYTPPAQPDEPV